MTDEPKNENACGSQHTDCELDHCPKCGSHGQLYLRSHPKFAATFLTRDGGGYAEDVVTFYAHEEYLIEKLIKDLPSDIYELGYIQRWNKYTKQWDRTQP